MSRSQHVSSVTSYKTGGIIVLLRRLFIIILVYILTSCLLSAQEKTSLRRPFQMIWHFKTENAINLSPTSSRDIVYLPLSGGSVISLTLSDGGLNWITEIGGNLSATPHADETGVFVASENFISPNNASPTPGALRALSRLSGVTLWMRSIHAPIQGGLISNDSVIFGGAADGRLYAIRKLSGEVLWVRQNRVAFASQPALSEGLLFLGDEDGNLWAIDAATGITVWRYRTRRAVRAQVAIVGENVFAGSNDGFVYAFNKRDGHLRWRTRTGAAVQSVTPTERCLVATSLDNFVYCLSLQKGHKVWKRQLAGRIAAQPLATDGGVLFAPLAGEECLVLDQKDGRKINSIFVGEDNNMAASPLLAGNLLLLTTRTGLMAFSSSASSAPLRQ
ncbi:MAG: PQQ-binding-like beta-propeller repeat protein [Acidobacteria bacterium]|nr:PQQ-binding-like beta-propeller repeat protein [Acidobacteriota bacterium]